MHFIGLIILIISGIGFVCFGFFSLRHLQKSQARSVPVKLLVTEVEEHRNKDGQKWFTPQFIILYGEHEGKRGAASLASSSPTHAKNDYVDGYFDVETELITTTKSKKVYQLLPWGFTLIGMAAIFAGLYLV
jgi:hypothetical protein